METVTYTLTDIRDYPHNIHTYTYTYKMLINWNKCYDYISKFLFSL